MAVIDTTGAGDLFASGYLFGRVTGASVQQSAELASKCAGEIICHFGARPEAELQDFVSEITIKMSSENSMLHLSCVYPSKKNFLWECGDVYFSNFHSNNDSIFLFFQAL